MKKSSKLILIFAVIVLVIAVVFFVLIKNKNESEEKTESNNKNNENNTEVTAKEDDSQTDIFEITGVMTLNNKITYYCIIKDSDDYDEIEVKAKDFDLPSVLMDYNDDIELQLKYSTNDKTVYDCKVINKSTGQVIDDISEDHLYKLFNIEYGKTIQEVKYVNEIYLSALIEKEIYKFQNDGSENLPTIINDIDYNCIVYTKYYDDSKYEKNIYASKNIKGDSISDSFNEGECLYIMFKKAKNDELLSLIEDDDILYIDDSIENGDELSYSFEKYIYNETDKEIKLKVINNSFGTENEKEYVIEPNEICGFDWMIDSVIVEY